MSGKIVVLGVGNTVLKDEGVGVAAAEALRAMETESVLGGVTILDGGTMGLALLPELEEADALLIFDAAVLGKPAGTVADFEGEAMDAFLRKRGRSPHDIGLDDLMDGLRLRDALPAKRALIVVQPQDMTVGTELSEPVGKALPHMTTQALSILKKWGNTP